MLLGQVQTVLGANLANGLALQTQLQSALAQNATQQRALVGTIQDQRQRAQSLDADIASREQRI
jgi:hypothetical protein